MSHQEDEFRSFVEAAVGGTVVALQRAAVGSSRLTLLVDVEDPRGERRSLVLRHDSGDGPLSGTDIDLAQEAGIYRALASQPVRIPRLIAEAADGRTLLVERAPGTEAFGAIEPAAERAVVAADFAEALAELHAIDPASLALPGVARPERAADHALLDLTRWIGIQRTRVEQPAEITRLAGDWLAGHPPEHVDRTALCHGDAGAGNFLHEGRRVTALLDWEFAHLGDPLDDVAWVLVRSHLLGGEAEMRAALPAWSRHAGLPLDPARIRYYRALVLLRMAISCQVALGHASRSASAMDTTTYEMLLPYLCFLLPQALREAGCREPALGQLAKEGQAGLEALPLLRGVARPLAPWEDA
jgi:aminoglycoside phosphotransferase (APT) family kinase protein